MRYVPTYIKMKQMVDNGELGEILSVWARSFRGHGFYAAGKRHRAVVEPAQLLLYRRQQAQAETQRQRQPGKQPSGAAPTTRLFNQLGQRANVVKVPVRQKNMRHGFNLIVLDMRQNLLNLRTRIHYKRRFCPVLKHQKTIRLHQRSENSSVEADLPAI